MSSRGEFWALVKHDLKGQKNRKVQLSRQWRLAYAVGVALVIVIVTTYAAVQTHIDLMDVWLFSFVLAFMTFGVATRMMMNEWKNGTSGWWLTLPVSRTHLVGAKFVASFIRNVGNIAIVYVCVGLLGLYTMLLQDQWSSHLVTAYLLNGLKWDALLVLVSPILIACGILFGALRESRLKPAIPLLWVVYGLFWWMLSSHHGHYLHIDQSTADHAFSAPASICVPIFASWVLAYGVIRFSSYLLDRQLAL
ncbi:ABC transporter permease [Alicyclobacillus fastidiosus]|uniref:ABC transporter permease n=1 Tax=Alicyclobacillus fastidiosus TaxID=392011 RepID=A0ABY6ZDB2_9BACL|nr:ABC transporter permease [Alicyclobacillus fastidiosus]WAH40831.1 ABC transporter permease [Alicyclobacillus fastidiosus]GMA62315.1 hypothetical protein GCM10025859_27550 [Alicyclobacillus fastidiosus]